MGDVAEVRHAAHRQPLADVEIEHVTGRDLAIGAVYAWSTFSKAILSEPSEFGLHRVPRRELAGGSAEDNAVITRDILRGRKGPKRDIVCLNAAPAPANKAPWKFDKMTVFTAAVLQMRPEANQDSLMREMKANPANVRFMRENACTVVCCTPTYALRMWQAAAEMGIDLARDSRADERVRDIVETTAKRAPSPAMLNRLEDVAVSRLAG